MATLLLLFQYSARNSQDLHSKFFYNPISNYMTFFNQYKNLQERNYLEQQLQTTLLHHKEDTMRSRWPWLPHGHNIETGN